MAARRYDKMDSSGRSSSDGLKFGQKIYFGDVGLGVSASPGKKGRGAVQAGQPPRCQVEGCDLDLSDAKAYYSRHKVCCMHSKSSTVIVGGIQQRFCQQCSRFHQLAEFDSEKRSCRRRLAGHNERRRKPPPGTLLSTRMGRLSPSVYDGGGSSSSSSNGFLVDFTGSLKAPEQSTWPGTKAAANQSSEVGKFLQGPWPGGPHPSQMYQVGPSIPSGECFAGVTDSSCALSLLSNQDWNSGHRAPPPPPPPHPPSDLLNSGHFSDNRWGFKVGEATGHSNNLGIAQFPHQQHHQPGGGDELDMAQHSASYGSSDHMNWLL